MLSSDSLNRLLHWAGGAIVAMNGQGTVSSSVFVKNSAKHFKSGTSLSILRLLDSARLVAGLAFCSSSRFLVRLNPHSAFPGSESGAGLFGDGGACYFFSSPWTVGSSTFTLNKATGELSPVRSRNSPRCFDGFCSLLSFVLRSQLSVVSSTPFGGLFASHNGCC